MTVLGDIGVVLLGHGSRGGIGDANASIKLITGLLKTRLGHDLVEPAMLAPDSGAQTMEQAVMRLAKRNAAKIIIAPMLLSDGAHLREGIPAEIARIQAKMPELTIILAKHIGADFRIADIMFDRVRQAYIEKEGNNNG